MTRLAESSHGSVQHLLIIPNGMQAQANPKKWSKRKKAAYSGGLVLDPKRGLYDTHIMVRVWSVGRRT
jgi:DNA polymerase elongation subunit (family B)